MFRQPFFELRAQHSPVVGMPMGGHYRPLIPNTMVYARMSYVVKSEGAFSAAFRCLIGLLTGDTASPGFWNIYFADFQLPHDNADIRLNGRPVCQLEQADDGVIFSTQVVSLQDKINLFYRWSRRKFMFISPPKSKGMIYGPLPAVMPILRVGDDVVEFVSKFKYVGMWFTSTHPNMFAAHYADKASKARKVANATFARVKTHLGSLPVREGWGSVSGCALGCRQGIQQCRGAWMKARCRSALNMRKLLTNWPECCRIHLCALPQGLQLYMARVDCYLISGGEISLDVDPRLLEEHIDIQQSFLRNLLGLNPASMVSILYTETGQTPIKIRRLLRALSRLRYLITLPPGEDRIVRDALLDSFSLYRSGKPCWIGDICYVLQHLPTPIHATEAELRDDEAVKRLMERVEELLDEQLQRDIDTFTRTHLLRGRVERTEGANGETRLGLVTRRRMSEKS